MSVLIEDSPRNLDGWITDLSSAGGCRGTVITPFATPWAHRSGPGRKPSARARFERLREAGVQTWFDPMTHSLQMSGVGDFRYYDEYDLWSPGQRGVLTTDGARTDHVRRVFELQKDLGVQTLAPTVLLHTGLSETSERALELAREASRQDRDCWLTVAGTSSFWASGSALDAHIGALAALEPCGWFLVPVKPLTTWPIEPDPEEVHGLCRAARALSEDARVHISHGDIAALPAVAAGATTVGSGWDKRQRMCSSADYAPRAEGSDGGSWLQRITFAALAGAVSANESDVLASREPALVAGLGGLPAPAPRERFVHHINALNELIKSLTQQADLAQRYHQLRKIYRSARVIWPKVQAATGCGPAADQWVDVFDDGLRRFGLVEGYEA